MKKILSVVAMVLLFGVPIMAMLSSCGEKQKENTSLVKAKLRDASTGQLIVKEIDALYHVGDKLGVYADMWEVVEIEKPDFANYQLIMDVDSMKVWDGERYVGAVPYDSSKISILLTKDNE